jgi:hypothetical protein
MGFVASLAGLEAGLAGSTRVYSMPIQQAAFA